MNVYDFDKTIYAYDSTLRFYFYSIIKKPKVLKKLPKQIISFFRWKGQKIGKESFKENFYSFLLEIDDVDTLVTMFWSREKKNIQTWYLTQKKETDIIISASPEFLINPLITSLEVGAVIASKVDKHTGKLLGSNCYGNEKVNRFKQIYGRTKIDSVYSDSLSDIPLGKLADNFYLVKGTSLTKYPLNKE